MHPEASPCRSRWSRALSLPDGDVRPLLLGLLLLTARTPDAARAQPPGGDPPPPSCGGAFDATADATVIEADPSGNHGTGPIFVSVNAGGEQVGLVSFDPGPAFPRDATVYQARLEMTLFEVAAGPDAAVEARTTDEIWNEATVTWDSRPLPLPTAAQLPLDRPPGQVVSADVTTLFRRWQQQGGATFDVALAMAEPGQASFFEHGVAGQPPGPRLVVSCAPVPEPAPVDPTTGDIAQQSGIALLESLSTVPVELRIERGAVRFASFDVPVPGAVGRNRDAQATWFRDQFSGLLRTPAAEDEWQLVRREPSLGAVFYRQLHRGIPVVPSALALFFADGSVRQARGLSANYVTDLEVDPTPRVVAREAEEMALALRSGEGAAATIVGDTRLVYLNLGLVGGPDASTHLVWQVQVDGNVGAEILFVDARNGLLRSAQSLSQDAFDLDLKTRNEAGEVDWTCWQPGAVLLYTESGPVVPNPPVEATAAFGHIFSTYDYWKSFLGRDSWDGQGRRLDLSLNVTFARGPNANYTPWCGILQFADQYAQLDVVGHEFTHGVVHQTSNLEYSFQSGALNESFADIFGHAVDPSDWEFGEDLPGGWRRDMSDPARSGRQPDRMPPWAIPGTVDNGGVHANSGIQNKAAYLLTVGGDFNGAHVVGIGEAKAQRFFYFLLLSLTGNSQFVDAANRAVALAQTLATSPLFASLGFTAADACSVRNAYAAVGLGAPDAECDGVPDWSDPDDDNDGVPDSVDNCDFTPNPSRANHDNDTLGDACDDDDDNDGFADAADDCPLNWDPDQTDTDGDGIGDRCEDEDGDGVRDFVDNCPGIYNPDQKDSDGDAFNVFPFPGGDACDPDDDNDTVLDVFDNCPLRMNVDQLDSDDDSLGDVCDLCPNVQSSDNADYDRDGKGDPCDPDADGDGVLNFIDNCPLVPNPGQEDNDQNGVGFACDPEEQSRTARELVLRSSYQLSQQAALRIPIPVCPTCGTAPLPPNFALGVALQSSAPVFARVVDSQGLSLDANGDSAPSHGFRFVPPAFGGTGWALAGGSAPAPEGDPAGRIRHYLELFPGPDTPAGEPVTLSITLSETLFADDFEAGDTGLWSATAP